MKRASRNSITLHREHGVNPSIEVCLWCGKETGNIVLLGNTCKSEAPKHIVTGYDPCQSCHEAWEQGILVIEMADNCPTTLEGWPPLQGEHWPTGRHLVISRDGFNRFFSDVLDDNNMNTILDSGACFMDTESFSKFMNDDQPEITS